MEDLSFRLGDHGRYLAYGISKMKQGIFTSLLCISVFCGCDPKPTHNTQAELEKEMVNAAPWSSINDWLNVNAPKIAGNLNPPATDEQIAATEAEIGIKMPDDWRQLYKTHNGMNHDSNFGSLFYGIEFLSLDKVKSEYESSVDLSADSKFPVKSTNASINTSDMNNPKWIALAHDGSGNMIRVDMDPGENGQSGQVIFADIDSDVVILLAASIDQFLHNFAADLQSGKYHLAEDALKEGDEYLNCVPEIDVINWVSSPKWKELDQ